MIKENKNLLQAFQNAAKTIPAYRSLLERNKINPSTINDIEAFKELVPIINKDFLDKNPLHELCHNWNPDQLRSITLSSGFSGTFALNVMYGHELETLSFHVDTLLDFIFNTSKKKTFCISALGQGVKVYTNLPLAETSIRADSVIALIKKISPYYEQTLIIGSTFFIKKVIEEGLAQEINWKSIPAHFLFGEDWFPENYRSYLAGLIGADFNDPQGKRILSTFGISELGLSLFQESYDTVRIRRLAEQNPDLLHDLFGSDIKGTPVLFHYHPSQIFLENLPEGLVFTMLDQKATTPLIRYASGDKGNVIDYHQLKNILCKHGYKDHVPQLQNPLVWVLGRKGKHIEINGAVITPEEVKTGIYSTLKTAEATTGYFRMNNRSNNLSIEIQLREDFVVTDKLKGLFHESISKYVAAPFEVTLYPYQDFPYGMALNYEKKFKYLD